MEKYIKYGHQVMVFKATFNDISVFLVEETTERSQVTDKLDHIMLY